MKGVEVVGPSSCETNTIRFRNLKKTTSTADPPIVVVFHISQVPPCTVDPIMELARATMGVNPSSLEATFPRKYKGKELSTGTPKKRRKKLGETSSGAAFEL